MTQMNTDKKRRIRRAMRAGNETGGIWMGPTPFFPLPLREQRYLILEYKVRMFEGVIHQDDEFAHDGGERDFGGFASGAKALVERLELAIGAGGDQCRHVESASDGSTSAADASSSMPLAAFARMGSQSSQCRCLAAVKGAQF